jgi:hypothetical protein
MLQVGRDRRRRKKKEGKEKEEEEKMFGSISVVILNTSLTHSLPSLSQFKIDRLERILTMVYVVQSYWACFGLYPSSCMWKTKNPTRFRRLDLSPSSGGWGRINLLSWAR